MQKWLSQQRYTRPFRRGRRDNISNGSGHARSCNKNGYVRPTEHAQNKGVFTQQVNPHTPHTFRTHALERNLPARADHLVRRGVVIVDLEDDRQPGQRDCRRHVEGEEVLASGPVGGTPTVVVGGAFALRNLPTTTRRKKCGLLFDWLLI